jgi:GNAT superfamily N-acetyltransferase
VIFRQRAQNAPKARTYFRYRQKRSQGPSRGCLLGGTDDLAANDPGRPSATQLYAWLNRAAAEGRIACLAVDRREQRRGLGKALLKDAIFRTMQAADSAGLKLLLVHVKDEPAADLARKRGFEPVVDEPLKLFLPVPLSG